MVKFLLCVFYHNLKVYEREKNPVWGSNFFNDNLKTYFKMKGKITFFLTKRKR